MEKLWSIIQWGFPLEDFLKLSSYLLKIIPLPKTIFYHKMVNCFMDYYNEENLEKKLKREDNISILLYYIEYWDALKKLDKKKFEQEIQFLKSKQQFITREIIIRAVHESNKDIFRIIDEEVFKIFDFMKRGERSKYKENDFDPTVIKTVYWSIKRLNSILY